MTIWKSKHFFDELFLTSNIVYPASTGVFKLKFELFSNYLKHILTYLNDNLVI